MKWTTKMVALGSFALAVAACTSPAAAPPADVPSPVNDPRAGEGPVCPPRMNPAKCDSIGGHFIPDQAPANE